MGQQITSLTVQIPVVAYSGDDYGAEAIQDKLLAAGWRATVIPRTDAYKIEVRNLHLDGSKPYDSDVGAKAIQTAASSLGVRLKAIVDWVTVTVTKVADVAGDVVGKQTYTKAAEKGEIAAGKVVQDIKDKIPALKFGAGAFLAIAAVLAGAFVIFQGRAASRAFSGLEGSHKRRRRR